MSMATGSNRGQKADINMTPMIDVLLVLIIIFMVITPLKPVGLRALVPEPAPPDQPGRQQPAEIVITVENDGTVLINQQRVDRAELGARLADIYRVRPNSVIFVRASGGLEFRQVAQVLDLAKGAGLMRVALMTSR